MGPMSLLLRVLPPIIVGSVPSLSWSHSRSAAASSHHHHLSGCDPRGKCRVPVALTSAKDVGKCGLHSACCQFVSLPVSHSVTLSLCTDDGYLKSQLLLPPSHSLYFTAFTASPRRDLRHLPGFPFGFLIYISFPGFVAQSRWLIAGNLFANTHPENIQRIFLSTLIERNPLEQKIYNRYNLSEKCSK